jgi:hypothetical protein
MVCHSTNELCSVQDGVCYELNTAGPCAATLKDCAGTSAEHDKPVHFVVKYVARETYELSLYRWNSVLYALCGHLAHRMQASSSLSFFPEGEMVKGILDCDFAQRFYLIFQNHT